MSGAIPPLPQYAFMGIRRNVYTMKKKKKKKKKKKISVSG
jgi:hypothetical protein